MTALFSILAGPLSWIMQIIYNFVGSYGWTIVIITVLVRLVMFPLSLKQEKSRAKNAAYQPMIREIQNKWKNDKNRQQQEVMKFQEENGIKMSAGCLPMLVNMIVLFGIIAVIQSPLQYMLSVPSEQIDAGVAIVQQLKPEVEIEKNVGTRQSLLIGEIINGDITKEQFTEGVDVTTTVKEKETNSEGKEVSVEKEVTNHVQMDAEWVDKIADYKFDFMGLNLAKVPDMSFNVYILLPILSVLTQFASQFIIMAMSKKEQEGQPGGQAIMWVMTIAMGIFFGFYAFTVPVGFSLYYTISNIMMTVQQVLVRKIHNYDKIKAEVVEEIEARKKAKKAKKTITIKTEDGKKQVKEVSQEELDRIRIAKARELDQKRYADDEAADKDGKLKGKDFEELEEIEETGQEKVLENPPETAEQHQLDLDTPEELEAMVESVEYKPGRRKRAKENKKGSYNKSEKDDKYDTSEKNKK